MNEPSTVSPSRPLLRSLLLPLGALVAVLVIWYAATSPDKSPSERFFAIGETLAETWEEGNGILGLQRLADTEGADRIWIASAAGRIIASSRPSEHGTFVDDSWWGRLPNNGSRQILDGPSGRPRVYAVHAVQRGRWALLVTDPTRTARPAWLWVLGLLGTGALVWLLAATVIVVGLRRHTRSIDRLRHLVQGMLEGTPTSAASLERARAESGPALGPFADELTRLIALLQTTADRATEAESRFAQALSIMPGVAYLADYSGHLMLAGDGFKRALLTPVERLRGTPVTDLPLDAPLDRIHQVALRLQVSRVVCDAVPVQADGRNWSVSLRSLRFRGVDAYFAVVVDTDAGPVDDLSQDEAANDLLYRQVVDHADEWIAVFDEAGALTVWNEKAERESGLARDDVPDLPTLVDALIPDDASGFRAWLESPKEPTFVTGVATVNGPLSIQWCTRTLSIENRMIGGALIGRALPSQVPEPVKTPERRRRKGRRKGETASGS